MIVEITTGRIVLKLLTDTTAEIVMQFILGCNNKTTVMFYKGKKILKYNNIKCNTVSPVDTLICAMFVALLMILGNSIIGIPTLYCVPFSSGVNYIVYLSLQVLKNIKPVHSNVECSASLCQDNIQKNRALDVLPGDLFLCFQWN